MTTLELVPNKPNEELVAHVENILERVKEGEVQGILEIVIFNDGKSSNGACIPQKYHDVPKLIGEMSIMQARFAQAALRTEG